MLARALEKPDYDRIVQVIDRWSGGPTSILAHPIFFYELGELGQVVEDHGEVVGFLFGFAARRQPVEGYVHIVGVHPSMRRAGIGRSLYERFETACREQVCCAVKSMTTPGNSASITFHQALGYDVTQVDDYAGPGRPRVVFRKSL